MRRQVPGEPSAGMLPTATQGTLTTLALTQVSFKPASAGALLRRGPATLRQERRSSRLASLQQRQHLHLHGQGSILSRHREAAQKLRMAQAARTLPPQLAPAPVAGPQSGLLSRQRTTLTKALARPAAQS